MMHIVSQIIFIVAAAAGIGLFAKRMAGIRKNILTGRDADYTGQPSVRWKNVLLLAFGIYLATDGDRWGDPFVTIGIAAVAIIALVGGGVVVPAVKALARLDPGSAEYDRIYRRYLKGESFLGAVVVLTIFAMAAKPFS